MVDEISAAFEPLIFTPENFTLLYSFSALRTHYKELYSYEIITLPMRKPAECCISKYVLSTDRNCSFIVGRSSRKKTHV